MRSLIKQPEVLFIAIVCAVSMTNFLSTLPLLALFALTDLAIIQKSGTQIFNQKSFKLITIFYVIFLLYGILGHGILATGKYKPQIFSAVSIYTVYLISNYIRNLDRIQIKNLLYISIFSFTICVAITSYISTIDPMAIRLTFRFAEEGGAAEADLYRSMGVMSYGLAHAISVISVGFSALFCYAKKKWLRIFSVCLWVLMIKLQFDFTITTALLLSILGSLIIIVNKVAKGKVLITLTFLIIIGMLFLSMGLASEVLGFAEGANQQIFHKLDDFFLSIESGSGQGQMDYRDELYNVSFNTFLSNPIFGWGVDNGSRTVIGEHSFLFDYLAYYGIFAFLYFGSWWSQYKNILLNDCNLFKQVCLYSFIPVCMLVTLKASSVCTLMPFASLVFLPLVFMYLQNTETENQY